MALVDIVATGDDNDDYNNTYGGDMFSWEYFDSWEYFCHITNELPMSLSTICSSKSCSAMIKWTASSSIRDYHFCQLPLLELERFHNTRLPLILQCLVMLCCGRLCLNTATPMGQAKASFAPGEIVADHRYHPESIQGAALLKTLLRPRNPAQDGQVLSP